MASSTGASPVPPSGTRPSTASKSSVCSRSSRAVAPRPVARYLPSILSRNGRLKFAAFALTVVLWALVRTDPSVHGDTFTVPVRAQVGDLGWTLAGEPDPSTVEVRLRGSAIDLNRLARQGTSLRIPLDSVARSDTVVQLRRDWVALEAGSGVVVE